MRFARITRFDLVLVVLDCTHDFRFLGEMGIGCDYVGGGGPLWCWVEESTGGMNYRVYYVQEVGQEKKNENMSSRGRG